MTLVTDIVGVVWDGGRALICKSMLIVAKTNCCLLMQFNCTSTYSDILTSLHPDIKLFHTDRIYSWSGDVEADKGVSTTNYLWPSKLSYYCSPTHRKQGLLCYCWMREKEWGSRNKAACVCMGVWRTARVYKCAMCVFLCTPCFVLFIICLCIDLSIICAQRNHRCVDWSVRWVLWPVEANGSVPESERKRSLSDHEAVQENTWELRENKQTQRREEEEEREERQDEEEN